MCEAQGPYRRQGQKGHCNLCTLELTIKWTERHRFVGRSYHSVETYALGDRTNSQTD